MFGISGSLIWSKTLMELIFNPCGEFRWSPGCPVSQIHSFHLHAVAPGIFSDLLKSVQMLKGEWGSVSNGKLPHLLIHSKTATLVPEFAVENLPLSRTAALMPEFAVKDLPLGRTLCCCFCCLKRYRTPLCTHDSLKHLSYIFISTLLESSCSAYLDIL